MAQRFSVTPSRPNWTVMGLRFSSSRKHDSSSTLSCHRRSESSSVASAVRWCKVNGYSFAPLSEKPVSLAQASRQTVRARITGYTSNEGGPRTATGTRCRWGTVAVDPRYIPLGSKVWIDGFPDTTFYAEDTGGAVKGWWVDVWVPDTATAYAITGWRQVTFEPPQGD